MKGGTGILAGFILYLISVLVLKLFDISGISFLQNYLWLFAAIIFAYTPIIYVIFKKEPFEKYGLQFHSFKESIIILIILIIATFPPYAFGMFFYQKIILHKTFTFEHKPFDLMNNVLFHLFFVALPEESFYRGLLQTMFNERFGKRWRVLNAEAGWGLILSNLLFTAGHIVILPLPYRIGVFFPGLLFGWLRERYGTILPAVLYHACGNIFSGIIEGFFV